jgi:hypothetical protein
MYAGAFTGRDANVGVIHGDAEWRQNANFVHPQAPRHLDRSIHLVDIVLERKELPAKHRPIEPVALLGPHHPAQVVKDKPQTVIRP